MSDNEMKQMAVHKLQDHGYIFLWVTGRAIELGRECLEIWGFVIYHFIECLPRDNLTIFLTKHSFKGSFI